MKVWERQKLLKKQEVGKILTDLGRIPQEEVAKEDGLMDFEKLKERPEIKEAMKKLKELNIDRKYLMENFFLAGMTIGHMLEDEE